jgi:hypothetical protein
LHRRTRRLSAPLTRPPPKSPPLWRFFLAATVIVLVAGSVLFAHHLSTDIHLTGKVIGSPTPSVQDRDRGSSTPRPQETFSGSGNWTMSALPGCFDEQSRYTGKLTDLRIAFPPEKQRLAAGTILRRGACTVFVRAHDIWIARGIDRVRVPPEARLYLQGDRLTLVAIDGTQAQIRHY